MESCLKEFTKRLESSGIDKCKYITYTNFSHQKGYSTKYFWRWSIDSEVRKPNEIPIMLLKYLDDQSIFNVYQAYQSFCMQPKHENFHSILYNKANIISRTKFGQLPFELLIKTLNYLEDPESWGSLRKVLQMPLSSLMDELHGIVHIEISRKLDFENEPECEIPFEFWDFFKNKINLENILTKKYVSIEIDLSDGLVKPEKDGRLWYREKVEVTFQKLCEFILKLEACKIFYKIYISSGRFGSGIITQLNKLHQMKKLSTNYFHGLSIYQIPGGDSLDTRDILGKGFLENTLCITHDLSPKITIDRGKSIELTRSIPLFSKSLILKRTSSQPPQKEKIIHNELELSLIDSNEFPRVFLGKDQNFVGQGFNVFDLIDGVKEFILCHLLPKTNIHIRKCIFYKLTSLRFTADYQAYHYSSLRIADTNLGCIEELDLSNIDDLIEFRSVLAPKLKRIIFKNQDHQKTLQLTMENNEFADDFHYAYLCDIKKERH